MKYIQKVIKSIFPNVDLKNWHEINQFVLSFDGDLTAFIEMYRNSENLGHLDYDRFFRELNNPVVSNALIYKLTRLELPITQIPFDFPAHNKKFVYEKGEKIKTSYFSQDEQLYFRKSRTYEYNERLTPQSVKITFEWFDDSQSVVFSSVRNVIFDSEIEKVKRRNSRLKTNYDFAITELGNSGQISPENFFILDSLLNQEKRFYIEGIITPLIEKIQDENFISQTPFLTESLRNKLVEDLEIT